MKKTFFYIPFCIVALFMTGCESDFVPFHETIPKGGFVRFGDEVENINFVLDLTQEANPTFEAPIVAPSDNVSNYDLSFVLATATGNFGPFDLMEIRDLPANLTFTAQDVADAAGVTLENLKGRLDLNAEVTREDGTVFTISDFTGDLNNPGQRQAMQFSVNLVCPSDLAGTFDFVHTNQVTGPGGGPCTENTLTGTVTWEEIGPGQYSTTDGSFGLFPNCWADVPVTGVTINDSCDLISVSGSDQYGDSYTYNVIEVNGTNLTIEWENTYGDGGTVVLTRQDGRDWPLLAS
jgi:hypothetical protein